MFDNLPNNQKPLSSLTVISCDSSFDSPCNSSSNELSHDITVKGESGFWVFGRLSNMYEFIGRFTRNGVYVIQDLLQKKSWDFGGALIIPYATGQARKL